LWLPFAAAAGQDPFVAEIGITTFNFAPKGWAFCDGQLLPLSQNTALFSLLGTTYGGNGKSNFALPDLQGRVPIGAGQGPGLSLRELGEQGGVEAVTLLESEIPAHMHVYYVTTLSGGSTVLKKIEPTNRREFLIYTDVSPSETVYSYHSGGHQPHNNMQPYLTVSYIIALQGVYPPRP